MQDLHSRPLAELPIVFFDLETTGLDLGLGHRVCEAALLRVEGAAVVARLDTLINPGRLLDPSAAAVNGLDDERLLAAPPFAEVAPAIEAILAGAVLVAHNLPFDLAFLDAELRRLGRPGLANPALDTLALARRLIRRPSHSLAALAGALGLITPTHRAMDDVATLRELFTHLTALMAQQEVRTLDDAIRLERGLLPGAPVPVAPPLLAQAMAEGLLLHIRYRSRGNPEPSARSIKPLYLTRETNGVYLRAYCYLRNDVRTFALDKIVTMALVDGQG
jgi:DNA polymerase-3 subunit epsilon